VQNTDATDAQLLSLQFLLVVDAYCHNLSL
jgi:hypothetical protein